MIGDSIKKLFAQKSANTPVNTSTIQNGQNGMVSTYNPNGIKDGETYTNYGKRICGGVNASNAALAPFLQQIYNAERNRQTKDKNIQDALKAKIKDEIQEAQTHVQQENNNLDAIAQKKKDVQEKIGQIKEDIADKKQKSGETNKDANAKMILGIIIIVPLTLYLFIFYSSTFYSAFFKDFTAASSDTGLKSAMFDANAIADAWDKGATELLFVLCAPIIFLGLGFCLHYFSTQKSKLKYLKMAALIVVTFAFDAILAYEIGQGLYQVQVLNELGEFPPYSVSLAIHDINTWAVIFCGFIVYIIWGLVFDMTYSGYENRRSNKNEIELLNSHLENEKKNYQDLTTQENETKNKIEDLKGKINTLNNKLAQTVVFSNDIIKTALNDFFTGWMSLMVPLGKDTNEQNKAHSMFESTMQTFFEEETL